MTGDLSVRDLVAVALRAVGPGAQVSDWGLLASAAARPQASAFGEQAYPELVDKAAALLVSPRRRPDEGLGRPAAVAAVTPRAPASGSPMLAVPGRLAEVLHDVGSSA